MPKKKSTLTDEELQAAIRFIGRETRHDRGLSDNNMNTVDRLKFELCTQMQFYMMKQGLKQRQLAKKLKVSESRVSEIMNFNIEKITIDKLVELLERLNRTTTFKVA